MVSAYSVGCPTGGCTACDRVGADNMASCPAGVEATGGIGGVEAGIPSAGGMAGVDGTGGCSPRTGVDADDTGLPSGSGWLSAGFGVSHTCFVASDKPAIPIRWAADFTLGPGWVTTCPTTDSSVASIRSNRADMRVNGFTPAA